MGGVAVQAFVTQFPEIAAERVAGIVLLSTLAYTPFGSRPTRTKARLEQLTKRSPDTAWIWSRPNLGFLIARIGFGKNPKPSHVELVRRMMLDCSPETRKDAPRVLVGLDLTAELPKVRIPTLVIGGSADALTPPFEASAHRRSWSRARRLELLAGRGSHAHAGAYRRARCPHRRLCDNRCSGSGGVAPHRRSGVSAPPPGVYPPRLWMSSRSVTLTTWD